MLLLMFGWLALELWCLLVMLRRTAFTVPTSGAAHWIGVLASSEGTWERQRAQTQLEALGESSVPSLVAALSSANPVLRKSAAEMLGYIASPSAGDALLVVLEQDKDVAVRREAALSTSLIPGFKGADALEQAAMLDREGQVREAARAGLETMRLRIAGAASRQQETVQAFVVAAEKPELLFLGSGERFCEVRTRSDFHNG